MKSYVINGNIFKSKKALTDRIKNILWSYKSGDWLSPNDFDFMIDVFRLHPRSTQKFGVGIKGIMVKTNATYPSVQEFWIVRIDTTQTDISYHECLSPESHNKRFKNACRVAIEPYIMKFKADSFDNDHDVICSFTGEKLTFVGSHVDHIPPKTFLFLLTEFISEHSIDIDSIEIHGNDDGLIQDTLADLELERLWIEYHQKHANLRVISSRANLSDVKRGLPK